MNGSAPSVIAPGLDRKVRPGVRGRRSRLALLPRELVEHPFALHVPVRGTDPMVHSIALLAGPGLRLPRP